MQVEQTGHLDHDSLKIPKEFQSFWECLVLSRRRLKLWGDGIYLGEEDYLEEESECFGK